MAQLWERDAVDAHNRICRAVRLGCVLLGCVALVGCSGEPVDKDTDNTTEADMGTAVDLEAEEDLGPSCNPGDGVCFEDQQKAYPCTGAGRADMTRRFDARCTGGTFLAWECGEGQVTCGAQPGFSLCGAGTTASRSLCESHPFVDSCKSFSTYIDPHPKAAVCK